VSAVGTNTQSGAVGRLSGSRLADLRRYRATAFGQVCCSTWNTFPAWPVCGRELWRRPEERSSVADHSSSQTSRPEDALSGIPLQSLMSLFEIAISDLRCIERPELGRPDARARRK
jgi:hypothetical protein